MSKPNFRFERKIWESGFNLVAGVDEVGRGALAGPVVAGCVVFNPHIQYTKYNIRIDDSKRLTSNMRNIADIWIRENALTWGIGESSASEIDRLGIVKATNRAMRKAIGNANQRLHGRIQYLLIDTFYIPYIRGIRMPCKNERKKLRNEEIKKNKYFIETHNSQHKTNNLSTYCGHQTAIIKGDQKSVSIASASIIAKVYRDNLMIKLSKIKKYKKYGWEMNKGYGTLQHCKMIDTSGFSYYHRKSFLKFVQFRSF